MPNPHDGGVLPTWDTLSIAAYSVYSQLPFKIGGRICHPQPDDAPCFGARDAPVTEKWDISTR